MNLFLKGHEATCFYNQIYCMDCMELLAEIPDGAVSLILTDPPYGISYQNHFAKHPHPLLTGDTGIDYKQLARESYRILQHNAHAYFFTRFDCYPEHYACLQEAGFQIKNCLVIEKNTIGGLGDLQGSFANNAEWLIFCQKGRRRSTTPHFCKTGKRKEPYSMPDVVPARSIKRASLPVGLAKNIPRQPTIQPGRKRIRFFILR